MFTVNCEAGLCRRQLLIWIHRFNRLFARRDNIATMNFDREKLSAKCGWLHMNDWSIEFSHIFRFHSEYNWLLVTGEAKFFVENSTKFFAFCQEISPVESGLYCFFYQPSLVMIEVTCNDQLFTDSDICPCMHGYNYIFIVHYMNRPNIW